VERVVRDVATGTSFVKIRATSLPVVSFGDSHPLAIGSSLVRVEGAARAEVATVTGVDYGEAVERNPDLPSRTLLLDGGEEGMSLFDASGKFLGLVTDTSSAVPVESVLQALSLVLRSQNTVRPSLGITVIDEYRLVPAPGSSKGMGARVMSVRAGSPAARAGIRVGDVILEAGGYPVGQRALEDILTERGVGSSLSLMVQHDDGTQESLSVNFLTE
jgi:serine protease Do